MRQFTRNLSSDKWFLIILQFFVVAIKIHPLLNEEDTTETDNFIEKILKCWKIAKEIHGDI